jgi:hypothetical protein
MSIRADLRIAAEISYHAAEINDFRSREFMSNVLISHAIKPRGGAEKRQIRHDFANSLQNSLLAGNCVGKSTSVVGNATCAYLLFN